MNNTTQQKTTAFPGKQKRLLLAAMMVLGSGLSTVNAQVGVGTITPNANAVLDMTATNKGFLPPRVALTAKNSVSPLSAFVSGMIVYNTATAGTAPNRVTPGLYYSNGSKWVRVVIGRNDQTVDVGNIAGNLPTPNPFTGATFTPNVPASADKIYIDTTDGSTWTYNGATYDSYVEDPSTPFYYANGTNDAGSNKTSSIYRLGNIGIGTSTPHAPLQFANNFFTRKVVLWEDGNNDHQFYGFGIGSFSMGYHVGQPTASHIFYADIDASSSKELMRIVGSGNVGIGMATPHAPLQFATALANRKIVMYENANDDNQFYGFGVSSGIVRYQVGSTGGAHVFFSGVDANTSNELVRITGAGNVGINDNTPSAKLDIIEDAAPVSSADYSIEISATNNNRVAAMRMVTGANGTIIGQNGNNADGGLLANAAYWGAPAGGHDFQIITSGMQSSGLVPAAAVTIKNGTNNVGLGTSAPTQTLQIQSASTGLNLPLFLRNKSGTGTIGIGFNNENGGDWIKAAIVHTRTVGAFGVGTMHFLLNNVGDGSSVTLADARMSITPTGNVGIGVTAPHAPLQLPNNPTINKQIELYEVSNDDHNFYGFGVNPSVLRYQVAGGSSHVFYAATSSTTSDELFRITANGDILPGVDNGGNCGIPSKRWTAVYAINGTIQTSDRNLKTNIKDINYGLKDIMKLRPVTYNWKTDPNNNHMVGLIAQEVEKVIPEAVVAPKEKGDYYGMKYNELVPVLIKGMQEQQAQITALENKIAEKDQRISTLEAKEAAYAQLAQQVKEMQQMLGMNKNTQGAKTAKR